MPTTIKTDKFAAMSAKMRSDAAEKLRPRETNTSKKLAQARASEREGQRLQAAADIVDAYIAAVNNQFLPDALKMRKLTKAIFIEAVSKVGKRVGSGFHDYLIDTDQYHYNTPVHLALRSLSMEAKSPEDIAKEEAEKKRIEIARAVDNFRNANIKGFFPTPAAMIEEMLDVANITDRHRVLEPSAGLGDIADKILAKNQVDLTAVELRPSLCEVLKVKGIKYYQGDFLKQTPGDLGLFDRIVMNPPFEKKAAVQHISHAVEFLADGGVLVALLPPHHVPDLEKGVSVVRHELPPKCFAGKDAFRQTSTSVMMISIRN